MNKPAHAAIVDVNTFIGGYPWRHVPHPDAASLTSVMQREGIGHALVGYLPAAWHRSVRDANRELLRELRPHAQLLSPLPCVNPSWPRWERGLRELCGEGVSGIRVYPSQWGISSAATPLRELAQACAEHNVTLVLTTRFEDARQRHRMDTAADVDGGVVRCLVRAHPEVRVLLTCAGRALIEETYWSLAPAERARLWFDISCIWGPPQDDLAHLLRNMGSDRFLFGSMWPLRLVQTPQAGIDLLPERLREAGLGSAGQAFQLLHYR
jgi:predicted TIM-barrel fold metal-dependent hydrolase